MELVNATQVYLNEVSEKDRKYNRHLICEVLEVIVRLLAPFAPHICEEIWHRCGFGDSIHRQSWPSFDEKLLEVEETEIAIQINGRVRGRVFVPVDLSKDELLEEARLNEKVRPHLEDKECKVITVPGRLINIVVR